MQKIIFAHQLRAVAAVSVLLAHFLGVFWKSIETEGITHHIGLPSLKEDGFFLSGFSFFSEYATLLGEFGVGIFFLISGFVIPFSLEKTSLKQFIVERVFRIYPVYIAGFTISVGVMIISTSIWEGEFRFSPYEVFSHYFILLREWSRATNIDGISWTLEIELKFYLFCALLFYFIRHRPLILLYTALLILSTISVILLFHFDNPNSEWYFSRQSIMMLLMFNGVSIYYFHIKKISPNSFYIFFILNTIIFLYLTKNHFLHSISPQFIIGFSLSIIIFVFSYILRENFYDIRILNHIANISYPLYVIHAWVGYVAIYSGLKLGIGAGWSVIGACCLVYLLTLVTHYLIEIPSFKKGKKLGRKFAR